MDSFQQTSTMPVPAKILEEWHHTPGALDRMRPPWESVRVVGELPEIADGNRVTLEISSGPLKKRWVAEYYGVIPGREFSDRQVSGPFAAWSHTHRFLPEGESHSRLEDAIRFRLPGGFAGRLVAGAAVKRRISRGFAFRHRRLALDLARHFQEPRESRTFLVTGATGLVGSELVPLLRTLGHRVHTLTRSPRHRNDIGWNPSRRRLDFPSGFHCDHAIHLAGENVAGGRWTDARKRRILQSRTEGTRLLSEKLAALPDPPRSLVCASGSSYYSSQAREPHDEEGKPGNGFLAKVSRAWEQAADPARKAGIRVSHARIGVVLSPAGGALAKLLPLFQCGLGGPAGSGRQRMSWISLEDLTDVLLALAQDDRYEGPVNAVAPEIVSNAAFSRCLGRVLRRPSVVPAPAAAIRAAFGKMAEETVLADNAVLPGQLQAHGYPFRFPALEPALRHILGKNPCSESD